ncbi:nitric oxide synthase [Amphritea opalescens]|uniref:Nitric oxide synthase n=1 Tax=Amphritea opalescens TaxID=2490544 RepID=A0A430KUX8_9GAMM|nr:PepSY domain-containing protein [Amphritea opalescens]RTE67290.1 nitric oxide synthase [Amphritea opalescens]
MLRQLHSLSGLVATLFVVLLTISGAVLSLNPLIERSQANIAGTASISVAELAGKLATRYPGAEQIQRRPSGSIIVYFTDGDQTGADLINPVTGETIGAYSNSPIMVWIKNLHRSYLLGTPGRVVAGVAAFFMLLLTFSGAVMLVNRLGGWRHICRPIQGPFKQRLHTEAGRAAVLGLILSASTGLYMSTMTFELIPDYSSTEPDFPTHVSGGAPASIDTLSTLKSIPLTEFRELVYPYPDDPMGVYSITTDQGSGFVDQSTGELLSYQAYGNPQKLYEFIYMLHTGEGLWWLGLLLGLSALAVPLMAWTGIQIWWKRKQSATTINYNSAARLADTVILVGSESNSTWGFAKTLHDALHSLGFQVHTASMNQIGKPYPQAKRMFILTATYGDGDAPASANHFLARLSKITKTPDVPVAVLGFGDRQFPAFCQFAKEVEAALITKGWPQLLPLETIHRQSPQEFARWGSVVGSVLDKELTLLHTPVHPPCTTLTLVERVDYGAEVQAPTAVLRFEAAPSHRGWLSRCLKRARLPHFDAGDLVGILPPDSSVPRFYSLASASKSGMLEICVRHHPDGLCSGFLHGLSVGDTIEAFIKLNPSFRPASGKGPVILIGAGTGIGPLVGFIRNNKAHRPMHLYWGGRSPQSDFLYETELKRYLEDKRLTKLNPVFSRISQGAYVQNKIIEDDKILGQLIEEGAQFLICGGRNMASSVAVALDKVIAPLGIDVATLKAQGRYREDVY